jgi:hypothetical protein
MRGVVGEEVERMRGYWAGQHEENKERTRMGNGKERKQEMERE